jgi:spore coat polysaccharide biosynthesis predicted glycosyltransferase SpsG
MSTKNDNKLAGNCILARPSSIGISHLTRLLLVAQELRDRGAEVVFAFNPTRETLPFDGCRFLPIIDVEIADFRTNVFKGYTRGLIDAIVDDELKAISEVKPN